MTNTNTFISIHRIKKIEMDKIFTLDLGSYLTHITIVSDNNESIEFSLFSEKPEFLEIRVKTNK